MVLMTAPIHPYLPASTPNDKVGMPVPINVSYGCRGSNHSSQMPFPNLLAEPIKNCEVSSYVTSHNFKLSVIIHICNDNLALNVTHLYRPALFGFPIVAQYVYESDRSAHDDLKKTITI
eukprot:scaffold7849_cov457-Prasinococcus_capsulatus_cf.AAC.14